MLEDLSGNGLAQTTPIRNTGTIGHTVGSINSITLTASSSLRWDVSDFRLLCSLKSCLAKPVKSTDFRSRVKRVSQEAVSDANSCQRCQPCGGIGTYGWGPGKSLGRMQVDEGDEDWEKFLWIRRWHPITTRKGPGPGHEAADFRYPTIVTT